MHHKHPDPKLVAAMLAALANADPDADDLRRLRQMQALTAEDMDRLPPLTSQDDDDD